MVEWSGMVALGGVDDRHRRTNASCVACRRYRPSVDETVRDEVPLRIMRVLFSDDIPDPREGLRRLTHGLKKTRPATGQSKTSVRASALRRPAQCRGGLSASPHFAMSNNGALDPLGDADRPLKNQIVAIQESDRRATEGNPLAVPDGREEDHQVRRQAEGCDNGGPAQRTCSAYTDARRRGRPTRKEAVGTTQREPAVPGVGRLLKDSTPRDSDLRVSSADPLHAPKRVSRTISNSAMRAWAEEIIENIDSSPDAVLAATYRDVHNDDAELAGVATEQ